MDSTLPTGVAEPGVRTDGQAHREDFLGLLLELSARFADVPAEDVDGEIEEAQRRVCACFGLDASWLWERADETAAELRPTHCFRADAVPPPPGAISSGACFPWCQRQLLAGHVVEVPFPSGVPPDAARDAESLRRLGLESAIALPLSTGGGLLIGALAFATVEARRTWPKPLVQRLRLVAQVMANALARKRTDRSLRESEARLAAAVDVAGLGFYELRGGAELALLDDRTRSLLGVPASESHRAREFWLEHVHPEDRERVLELSRRVLDGALDSARAEYRYRPSGGGVAWLHHVSVVLERDAAGRASKLVGVVRDVTERKRAEDELQRLHVQLWHADRAAQVGVITASLAHELNQPLAAILANAQAGLRFMAAGRLDLEEIRAILTDIVQDDKRAGAVVSGLRAMLRRRGTQRESVALGDAVQEVFDLLRSELIARGVQPSLRWERDTVVSADRTQMQQVILNLAMNAIDAMEGTPAEERRLDVTLERTGAGEALVAVRDRGTGVPEDQRPRLFEPFWTTKETGMGIGLAISRSIVESYGGRLWFENNPGRGATFFFTLPCEPGPEGAASAPPSAAPE